MVGNLRAVASRRGPTRLSVMALAREARASTNAVAAGANTARQCADGSIGPCLEYGLYRVGYAFGLRAPFSQAGLESRRRYRGMKSSPRDRYLPRSIMRP